MAKWQSGKRRSLWFFAVGFVALAAVGAVRWSWSAPRPNLILVTFDTTRADRLGAYGYDLGETKGFDDFVRRGVVFERAYAPAPITLPSHATILTGLYPPEHGLRVNGSGRLDRQLPVLPEILQEHGYDTGAFIAAVVLDSKYGLDRGFDVYDDDIARSAGDSSEPRRDGKEVVDLALQWLRGRTSRPFFCWIHLFDAHAPYDSRSARYGQKFSAEPYDAGVAWESEQFSRVTNYLKDHNLDAKTLVVVAGDHGEGLDEHLETEHGMLVYNSTLQVPLAFAGPAFCQPGLRVSQAVSLVDVMPTLLDLLQIPITRHVSGRSLLAALAGRSLEARDYYAEAETPYVMNRWSPLRTVISDRWKYIETTRPELYDLERDPGELTNLADSAGEERERLRARLTAMQGSFVSATAQTAILSERDLANLQTLGYVSGGKSTEADGGSPVADDLPDVKDFLPQLAKFEKAKHLGLEGKLEESIVLLQEVVQATHEFPTADLLLGDCLAQAGRLAEAATIYRSLLARRPDFVRVHYSLGRILAGQGEFEQAATAFREFIQGNPDAAAAHFELAQVLSQLQQFDEAVREYREALRLAPEFVAANISLGRLLSMRRQPGEAADCFEQALAYDRGNVAAHGNLLILLAQKGEFGKALQHGEQAAALDPHSFEVRFNLGLVLLALKRNADGIAQLRESQRLRPDDPRPGQYIQQAEAAMRKGGR
ncbi:MAG: sulfatase-like hydrolase/transferase [Planctomycetaceae bacterium]